MTLDVSGQPVSDETEPPLAKTQIIRGNPTDEELAALLAVITEAYQQEAASAVADDTRPSAWGRSRRSLRSPLRRDVDWGKFSG